MDGFFLHQRIAWSIMCYVSWLSDVVKSLVYSCLGNIWMCVYKKIHYEYSMVVVYVSFSMAAPIICKQKRSCFKSHCSTYSSYVHTSQCFAGRPRISVVRVQLYGATRLKIN